MLAASLAVLGRPRWWPIALAGFLVRGGVLVVLLPIVIPPTPAGLANTFGSVLVGFVFGGPSPAFTGLVVTGVLAILAWLLASAALGAWLDSALAREAADDEELEVGLTLARVHPLRGMAVRLLAHLPTAVVLAWSAVRLVGATYQELVSPGEPGLPIVIRVGLRAPEAVGLVLVAWMVGEAAGGIALRRLAVGAAGEVRSGRALLGGFLRLLRPSALATLVVTNAAVALVAVGGALATHIAWDQLRVVLVGGGTGAEVGLAMCLFMAAWLAVLGLLGATVAWRAVAWTVEVARTIGPSPG